MVSLSEKIRLAKEAEKNKPKVTPGPKRNNYSRVLSFEQVINLMISHGENSSLWDYKKIATALKEGDRNAQFQSKRIKDALRMLFDMKMKISK